MKLAVTHYLAVRRAYGRLPVSAERGGPLVVRQLIVRERSARFDSIVIIISVSVCSVYAQLKFSSTVRQSRQH